VNAGLLKRWWGWGLAVVAAGTVVAGAGALSRSKCLQAQLLQHVPGVRVTAPQGNVFAQFQADVIEVDLPRGGLARIEGVRWEGLGVHMAPQAAWHVGVSMDRLQARKLSLKWVANPTSTPGAPTDVSSPIAVRVARLEIGEAHSPWWGAAPLKDVQAALAVQGLAADVQGLADPLANTPNNTPNNKPNNTQANAPAHTPALPPTQPRHAVELKHVAWQGWSVAGSLVLATNHGLTLGAALQGSSGAMSSEAPGPSGNAQSALPATPLDATVLAQGQLADLQLALAVQTPGQLPHAGGVTPFVTQAATKSTTKPTTKPTTKVNPPAEAMSLHAQAGVQMFADWPLQSLKVRARQLDASRLWPQAPHTRLQGDLDMAPDGPQALLAHWRLANEGAGPWSDGLVPVSRTQGQMRWPQAFDKGRIVKQPWQAGELDATVDGPAALAGSADSARQAAGGQWHMQGGWGGQRALSLAWRQLWLPAWDRRAPPMQWAQGELKLSPLWPASGAPALAVPPAGRWTLKTQGQVQSPIQTGRSLDQHALTVDGQGAWTWQQGDGALTVQSLSLTSEPAQARIQDARVSWSANGLQALSGQLALQRFDPALWLPWPQSMTGRNALSGEGRVQLNALAEGSLSLNLQPSMLAGLALQGQADWRTAPRQAQLQATLDIAGNALNLQSTWPRQPGQGAWPHDAPAWAGTHAQLQVDAPSLAALHPVMPLLGLRDMQGTLHLQGGLDGTWPNLATRGDWRAQGLRVQAERGPVFSVGQAQGKWQWDGRQPSSPADVDLDITQAEAVGWRVPRLQAQLHGLLREHHVHVNAQAVVPGRSKWAGRTLNLVAQGQGAWQGQGAASDVAADLRSAVASWQGQLQQWRLTLGPVLAPNDAKSVPEASPPPEAAKATVAAVPSTEDELLLDLAPTTARWSRDAAGSQWTVAPTGLRALGADLQLDEFIWRQPAAGHADGRDRLKAVARLVPFDVVGPLQRWQPDAGWGGKLIMAGQVQVARDAQGAWRVAADLGRQSGDVSLREPTIEGSQAQALGIRESRIQLRAEGGEWHLSQHFDGALLGRFEAEQTVHTRTASDLPGPTDALKGRVLLTAPSLRPWGTWMPAGWRLTGDARAEAALGGTLGAPSYEGLIEAQHVGLSNALMGVQLRDGELQARLAGDTLTLNRLVARSGDAGSVTVTGEARLLAPAQAAFRVQADRFAVLQRVDRRLVISGDTQLSLTQEDIGVEGALRVDEGLFDISRNDAPTIGDDVNVLNPEREAEEESSGGAGGRKTRVKLDIDLGQRLRIQGRGLEATLTGKLKAGMSGRKPTVQGTVAVVQGRYAAYGQKLVVERSTVVFSGPVDNPRLDILAMRPQSATATNSDVKVGVSITGTAQDPRIRLYSDPELSETEKLSWLVLGRAPSGLGGADIGLLQSAAVALLSGEGKSTSDNLIGALGLDELSVHQSEGTVRETVVNVGKQVSRLWYVGYERNLNATTGSWQLVYRLAQRFMVRLQAGEQNALDLIWSWRWD
jgi:translocation and assembly module TamB